MGLPFHMERTMNYEFMKAMENAGIVPLRTPRRNAAGYFRFPVVGGSPYDWCGWYRENDDGSICYGDFSRDISLTYFPHREHSDPVDLDEYRVFVERQLEKDKTIQDVQRNAAALALDIFRRNSPALPTHHYLVAKRVGVHGIRQTMDGRLIIPLVNGDGRISTLQFISENGSKRLLGGGCVQGCFHAIGDHKQNWPIVIVEGYATAASTFENTGVMTVMAINAGNIPAVTGTMRDLHPDARIIILADNDALKGTNTGLKAARKTCEMFPDVQYVLIPVPGMDANDYVNAGHDLIDLIRRELDEKA